ncbi:hypothetical protein ACM66B_003280 [Microbotryomycetes sp. NB124-2]
MTAVVAPRVPSSGPKHQIARHQGSTMLLEHSQSQAGHRRRPSYDDLRLVTAPQPQLLGATTPPLGQWAEDDLEDLLAVTYHEPVLSNNRTHEHTQPQATRTLQNTATASTAASMIPRPASPQQARKANGQADTNNLKPSAQDTALNRRRVRSSSVGARTSSAATARHRRISDQQQQQEADAWTRLARDRALQPMSGTAVTAQRDPEQNRSPFQLADEPTRPAQEQAAAQSTPMRAQGTNKHQTQSSNTPSPKRNQSVKITPKGQQPKPRQKSFSTAHGLGHSLGGDDNDALPPWMVAGQPKLFRDASGSLSTSGRPEDLVLPAVARRLQAERLERSRDDDNGLITTYDRQGRPLLKQEIHPLRRLEHASGDSTGLIHAEPAMQGESNLEVKPAPAQQNVQNQRSEMISTAPNVSPSDGHRMPTPRRISVSRLPLVPGGRPLAGQTAHESGSNHEIKYGKGVVAEAVHQSQDSSARQSPEEEVAKSGCCNACIVS